MGGKLIKTVDLKNGLRLEISDSSHNTAADRWQVVLTIRINIPVDILSHGKDAQMDLNVDEIISTLGENVYFQKKRERNFIDVEKKDEVFNNLIESFFSSSLDYVSNPDFPKRYILGQYKEYSRRKAQDPNYQDE